MRDDTPPNKYTHLWRGQLFSIIAFAAIFSHSAYGDELTPGQYYDRAAKKIRLGDNIGAIEDCTYFIDGTPSMGLLFKDRRQACFSYRGLAKERESKYKEAIEDYTKALDLDPQDAFSWAHRGVARMKMVEYNDAIADLSKSIKIDPNNHFYLSWRADASASRLNPNHNGAIADYTEAINNVTQDKYFSQNTSDYYSKRAHVKIKIADFDGANSDFERIKKLFPQYSKKADFGLAEVVINKAIDAQKSPSSPYRDTLQQDDRREVIQTNLAPFNSVIFIDRLKTNGVISSCTGALVLSPLIVATAAHCINKENDNKNLTNPIYISSKDSNGKTIDKVEAKVLAIGSGWKYNETDTDFFGQLNTIIKESKQKFGDLNGLSKSNQVDLFAIGDWAVLVLDRKLKNTQEISLIDESFKQINELPGQLELFFAIGFPGDWPGNKMIVTKCPTRRDDFTKWFNSFSDKINGNQFVALNFSRNQGCTTYSGHSGGPLIFYDYNLGKYVYAGVLASGHGDKQTEIKNNEKFENISEIRQKQDRIPNVTVNGKYYDGALSGIGNSFIISTEFIRAIKKAHSHGAR